MAIRQKENEGKTTFEVSINLRSKIYPELRVQKMKTQVRTLREAQLIERELIRECSAELERRESSDATWVELIDRWELAHRQKQITRSPLQANTVAETVSLLRKKTPAWFKLGCHEIKPGDVRKVLNQMETEGYSKSRLKALKSAINSIYKWGIEENIIRAVHRSPADGIVLNKELNDKPPQILALGEIHKLLEAAKEMDHEWYPIWAMALNTGMRSGELYSLEWNDIDWDNKLLTVSKSYNGRLKIFKSTKAGYWRKVPMNSETETLLKELRVKADGPFVLPRLSQWRRGEAARILREFCLGIGIRSIHFHALRACFATHLLNCGVTSPVVKKICGWTDEKVMTRYIRLAGIDVSGATESLNFIRPVEGNGKVVSLGGFRASKGEQK